MSTDNRPAALFLACAACVASLYGYAEASAESIALKRAYEKARAASIETERELIASRLSTETLRARLIASGNRVLNEKMHTKWLEERVEQYQRALAESDFHAEQPRPKLKPTKR